MGEWSFAGFGFDEHASTRLGSRCLFVAAAVVLWMATAAASTISGTVSNGTTKQPAGNVDVILLDISQGAMNEAARTKTDSAGRFQISRYGDARSPRLLRAMYKGVSYHKLLSPGDESVSLTVFDSTDRLKSMGITVAERYETNNASLLVAQQVAITNVSDPPLTQAGARTFEVHFPPEAKIESTMAQSPGGQPVRVSLRPGEHPGQYFFSYPLRPGRTRVQTIYRLPYTDHANLASSMVYPVDKFVVVAPRSMSLKPADASLTKIATNSPDHIYMASGLRSRQTLSFTLSGFGNLDELREVTSDQSANRPRPGGGIGAPIDLPDPLSKFRWTILLGLSVLMATGAFFMARTPGTPWTQQGHNSLSSESTFQKGRRQTSSRRRKKNR